MAIFATFIHHSFIMAHFVQEAFILIMVLLFLSKLRSFLGLWQFVSLCLRSGEIHSRWRWIFLERICLCLVWRFSRGHSAFSSPLILRGYQSLIDLVRNATPSLTFGPSRFGSVNYSWIGFFGRSPGTKMRWFFLRALRFFVHLNTAWFHGLHWMDWNPFQWLFRSWSWTSGGSLWFWWRGVGKFAWIFSRGAAFQGPVLHLYICWGET